MTEKKNKSKITQETSRNKYKKYQETKANGSVSEQKPIQGRELKECLKLVYQETAT